MILLALSLASVIGLALGLLGGGGSILTLPMLVYVLRVDAKEAIAGSLFVVGVTSLVGVLGHAKAGRVRWKVGALFGASGMAGAAIGGQIAPKLPAALLLALFAGMMLVTAVGMLRPRRAPLEDARPHELSIPKAALIGAAVGLLSGLVGAGGGFLVVPALVLVGGLAMPEAVGTSLLVIAMQALAGFASHAGHTPLHLELLAVVTGGAVAGSFAGIRLARHVKPDALRRAFGVMVLMMGVLLLALQLPEGLRFVVLVVLAVLAVLAGFAFALRRLLRGAPRINVPIPVESTRK